MRLRRTLLLALILLISFFSLQGDSILPARVFDLQVEMLIAGRQFNLVGWVIGALGEKAVALVQQPAPHPEANAADLVQAYMRDAARIGRLEGRLIRSFSESKEAATQTETLAIRDELAQLRQAQAQRRPQVEAILEEQVSAVLRAEGLTTLGVVWPPVKFRFSEPPLYLIISPRETIRLRKGVHLRPDIDVAQREELESAIDARLGVSSLVEELGGFGAYPVMIIDRAGLDWILSTIAHEWTHNYLVFHPLGWHYYDGPDTITLNETVASIVGEEVGAKVLATYYPDLTASSSPRADPGVKAGSALAFDFNATMRETRLRVDELLAQGKVKEAEAYMESQRQVFVAHGYPIRKLNQAYFAFHGSYATGPGAVDPIGPKLERLRQMSPSLQAFLKTAARFRSVADLDRALASLEEGPRG